MYVTDLRRFTRIYSLGQVCQPAYQIKNQFGYDKRGPFDWWITYEYPLQRLLLNPDWRLLYNPDHLEEQNGTIWNKEIGIEFYHEFRVPKDTILRSDWRSWIPYYESRTRYLMKRMLEPGGSILFIRMNDDTGSHQSLLNTLDRAYLNTPWNILFIPNDGADQWQGNDEYWKKHTEGYSLDV